MALAELSLGKRDFVLSICLLRFLGDLCHPMLLRTRQVALAELSLVARHRVGKCRSMAPVCGLDAMLQACTQTPASG